MPVSTTCPQCKALFRLADEMAGKRVMCQKCRSVFLVPTNDGATTLPGTRVADPGASSPATPAPVPATESTVPASMPLPPWPGGAPLPPAATVSPPAIPAEPAEAPSDEDDESSSMDREGGRRRSASARRRKRSSSNTGMMVGLAILMGGGLLSCLLCGGGLAYWLFTRDKNHDGVQVVFNPQGAFRDQARLTLRDRFDAFDPLFGPKRHKIYLAPLEGGKTYQIDLMSRDFDAFLHVIDEHGLVMARDDDGGEGLNSRLMLRPPRTGLYRIHATSLDGDRLGNFTLIITRFGDAGPPQPN